MSQKEDKVVNITLTVVLMTIFMIILEKYNPFVLYVVINDYLSKICINGPLISWKTFPNLPSIHNDFYQIKSDCMEVFSKIDIIPSIQTIDPSQLKVVPQGSTAWKSYMLFIHGRPVVSNLLKCMNTNNALRKINGLWNAFFSFLAPNTVIRSNVSYTKSVIRYHLGISIPEQDIKEKDQLYLKISDKKYTWKENEGILFDPTYPNSMVNNTSEYKIILFIDLIRPLEGFADSINKIALGMAAKHKTIDNAIIYSELKE